MSGVSPRHLQPDAFAAYLAGGVPVALPLPGTPPGRIFLDPAVGLSVLFPRQDEALPDVSAYEFFSVSTNFSDGIVWAQLTCERMERPYDEYLIMCAIADRVQLDGVPFTRAVARVLADYRTLLAREQRLALDEEVGLICELLFLRHLMAVMGGGPAMDTWRAVGPAEHDFSLSSGDVEVKGTLGERRRHWVGSLEQLQPTAGRSLWVLSVQMTETGADGTSLQDLVEALLDEVPADLKSTLQNALAQRRWSEDQECAGRRYRLRSGPAAYLVDERFPALTPARLLAAGLPIERLPVVTYQCDLSGMAEDSTAPAELIGFCEGSGR